MRGRNEPCRCHRDAFWTGDVGVALSRPTASTPGRGMRSSRPGPSGASEQIKDAVKEGYAWIGGLAELRDVTYVGLPTSHWPMWSRPQELAPVIGDFGPGASGV